MFKITLILGILSLTSATIILKPEIKQSTYEQVDVGLILLQGAQINGKNYRLINEELQKKFFGNLWVAISEFPLSTPQPLTIGSEINGAFNSLKNSGMKITKETPFFFVGHSLGGVMIQDYIFNEENIKKLPAKLAGLILQGSYISRKNYDNANKQSTPPILAMSGDLDGLNRISRMAESYYFDNKNKQNTNEYKRLTLIVSGMNHYQFAGEGEPPYLVSKSDIKAEKSNEQTRDEITDILSAFISLSLNRQEKHDKDLINSYKKITQRLLDPIVEALEMEGSYHFYPPCSDKPNDPECKIGCPWSTYSQKIMGSLEINMTVSDEFHPVHQINPIHLPAIHNKCDEPFRCILNISTVTQLDYSMTDSLDISLYNVAANEIKTKLTSRQSVLLAASGKTIDLKETDGGDLCADINKASLDWAISKTPHEILARYKLGKELRMGNDIGPLNIGPLWIWKNLEFNNKVDSLTKKSYVELRAPMMKTPVDYLISSARGFHYCKVLSPARAIEWIYYDSLQ